MVFLHGGVPCPVDLAAVVAVLPGALAVFWYARAVVRGWFG
jgi:hypothetical protein